MRRASNLFEQIPEYENLCLAFHKAALGRRSHVAVRQFSEQLDLRLATLSSELLSGTMQIGRFQQFLIRDPKERVITAPCFEERVLHHAIMNVCEPVMDRWLIADTYACRVGRGREAAVQRSRQFTHRAAWFLKLDVRKYFDSVPHDRLIAVLASRFRDRRLLDLLERIIRGFRGAMGVGLPIGSLTSQHFANLYLGGFDRFVKEVLRVRGYVRYMDDMVLWHSDREWLRNAHDHCREFAQTQLGLEFKNSEPRPSSGGLSFLGCKVFSTHVELNQRSKRRYRRRVHLLERAERLGLLTELELQQRLTSLTAFARAAGARSWRFRQCVLQERLVNDPKRLEPG